MLTWSKAALAGASALFAACATPGTRPHDMSIAQHENAATTASTEAAAHAARFDPTQTTVRIAGCVRAPCSPEEVNPTAKHRQEAADLEAAAAQHRKAAEELRTAEARACAGLEEEEQELQPLFREVDVAKVEPLYGISGSRSLILIGAKVVLADSPGRSAASVQKQLDCHVARNAAMGFNAPAMSYCPLAAKGVHARAREKRGHVIVEMKADTSHTADEVFRRAGLLSRP